MQTLQHTKEITLPFLDTQNHGYLKISKYDLQGLEISAKEFSNFSYYDKETACFYLEEDCDMTKFIKLAKEKGCKVLTDYRQIEYCDWETSINNYELMYLDEIDFEKELIR